MPPLHIVACDNLRNIDDLNDVQRKRECRNKAGATKNSNSKLVSVFRARRTLEQPAAHETSRLRRGLLGVGWL